MAELFDRRVVVTLDAIEITGLRVAFEITKTLKKEPNKASLTVYNLSATGRKNLQKDKVRVTIQAGYKDNIAQIFAGDMRNITSINEGTDWLTKMEADDGGSAYRTARVNKSMARASLGQAVKAVADSMGVGLGNVVRQTQAGKFGGAVKELSHGLVLRGRAPEVLDRLVRGAGYEWSIQDGQIQVLERGQALEGTAVVLTPTTGLVGSPELGTSNKGGEKGKASGATVLKLRALLQPDIFPGRKLQVRSDHIDAFFRAEVVRLFGDNYGTDWYADIEARPL